jgi:hypothetical protein
MPKVDDIDKPGGWFLEVTTRGNPPLRRFFKVYELEAEAAVRRLNEAIGIAKGETAKPLRRLNVHEFTGDKMSLGDVKQHV